MAGYHVSQFEVVRQQLEMGAGLGSVPPPTPTPAPPTPSPQTLMDNNVTTIINNVASDVGSNNHVIVQHIPQSSLIHEQVIPQPTPPPTPQQPLRSATPQQITIAAPINSNPATLELTREQMVQAQEMFKNANIVSRTEKALILGFMAGVRENPCPTYGNVVTIKLSESQEIHPLGDPVLVEHHFQMNYNTGEWKKIKKVKTLVS
ncbi:hypothetical protein M8J77_007416 [Diaphorina citri]|nr:hypothetical protein M8J77_007416 [Diaphorina citri]